MKLKDFVEMLQAAGLPDDAEVMVFDADMREMMPVTAKEIINAIAFAVENGGIDTLLIGDNEAARLVEDWRKKAEVVLTIPAIDFALLDDPQPPTQKLKDLMAGDTLLEAEQAATAEASERRRLRDEVRRLRKLLNERDEFIVNNDMWHKFTSEL